MSVEKSSTLPFSAPTRVRVRFLLALSAILAMVGSVGVSVSLPAYANGPACGPLVAGVHQVSTVDHLKGVGSGGVGTGECGLGAQYLQVNDIDVSGESSWTGIGTDSERFTGEYDGNFTRISGGQVWGSTFFGFFSYVGPGGTVKNLGVTNIRVSVSTTLEAQSEGRGLLVGENRGTVENSFATGSITSGDWFVGGLVGYNTGTIEKSFASVTISGSATDAEYVGGLVGLSGTHGSEEPGVISDSYARGSVSGEKYVGGLAGSALGGTIARTYAAASVTGASGVTEVGGLVGRNFTTVTDSYYDQDVSGQTGGDGTATPTSSMKTASTYAGWGLVASDSPTGPSAEVWGLSSLRNSGYPFLWWWSGPVCGPLTVIGGEDWHQVSTVDHLKGVGSGGVGTGECGLGAQYIQVNDIDVSGESSWTGIGTSVSPFTGEYDGNFTTLNGGPEWGSSFKGFFAYVGTSGTVRDLGVINIRVSDPTIQSDRGLLVGTNKGTVVNTYAVGSITTSGSRVGGLVGDNQGSITTSFASVSITGVGTVDDIGGLVGRLSGSTSSVTDSYSTGSVSGFSKVGGLAGSSTGTINRAYSTTEVTVTFEFGSTGGLVALNVGTVTDSYFDATVSGLTAAPGLPKLSSEMRTASTYTGWPLVEETTPDGSTNEKWGIHPSTNSGYPFLWWQEQSAFCPILEDSVRPIRTPQQLASVGSGGVNGPCSMAETYEQKNDIDLANFGNWYPIGVKNGNDYSLTFSGEYRGAGYGITNLRIINSTADFQGLFGTLRSTGTISGVRLRAPVVDANDYVGALVGWSEGSITQSEVTGAGQVTGRDFVGGLAGRVTGSGSRLSQSLSTIPVEGVNTSTTGTRIGGLVGLVDGGGTVADTFAAGSTTGRSSVGSLIGELVIGTVQNSFATGSVSGSLNVNGLIGKIPSDPSAYTVTSSFYDVDLAGSPTGQSDYRKTAAQLRDISTFDGWDIVASTTPTGPAGQIWGISPTKNSGYPFLWWNTVNNFCGPAEPPLDDNNQQWSTSNPYRVLIPGHLNWIAGEDLPLTQINATVKTDDSAATQELAGRLNKSYRQDIDLDFSDCSLLPIGLVLSDQNVEYPFYGVYDGNSHDVSHLRVVAGSTGYLADVTSYLGFFGRLDGTVRDLSITDAVIDATSGKTVVNGGILAGEAWTGTDIRRVNVSGSLIRVSDYAGGLIGRVRQLGSGTDPTRLEACSADVRITSTTTADGFHIGGLVGSMDQVPNNGADKSFSFIDECSVTADIVSEDHRGFIGGLVGRVVAGSDTGPVMFTDIANTGDISLTTLGGQSSYVGGALGHGAPVMLDVDLPNVTITTTGTPEYAGGLVGQLETGGVIDDSFVTGTMTTSGAGAGSIGGLVGAMSPDSDLEDSAATMTINASLPGGDLTIGGLVGFQDNDANVRSSYSAGVLTVDDPRGSVTSVGGVTGRLGNGARISNSWSEVVAGISNFDGTSRSAYVGGFVGDMDAPNAAIEYSYSTGNSDIQGPTQGGFVGEFLGRRNVDNTTTAGTITGAVHGEGTDSVGTGPTTGITAATPAQMVSRAFFVGQGWPIAATTATRLPSGSNNEIWGIVDGAPCSPFLFWQASSSLQTCQVPDAPASSSTSTASPTPTVAPLPPVVPPGRSIPVSTAGPDDEPAAPAETSQVPSEEAERVEDIATSAPSAQATESSPQGVGWLMIVGAVGLGGVLLLGAGLAWWRTRVTP